MMTTAFLALSLLASHRTVAQSGLHWPLVPGPQFVINGIDSNGTALIEHVKIAEHEGTTSIGAAKLFGKGTAARLWVPEETKPWKTLQIVFTPKVDGTLVNCGGINFVVRDGFLWFGAEESAVKLAPILTDDLNDVQIISHLGSLLTFVNGKRTGRSILAKKPLLPVEVGLDKWKGAIVGIAAYTRELSVDELYGNETAAKDMAKALFADTPKVTIEAELTAVTPVPELERIRPYRSALLAEEYKVVRVVSGRMSAIKPGTKIRVFRYGIKAGEKTALKDAKLGDHAEMLIQPYDSDPKFSREFQVDTLDPDISIPLFVDVSPAN